MKGSSASAGGDDSLDLDAILAGGCAGGSGGNRASLKRFDADQSGTSDAKEFAAALGAPVGIEASDGTETRASSAAVESCLQLRGKRSQAVDPPEGLNLVH